MATMVSCLALQRDIVISLFGVCISPCHLPGLIPLNPKMHSDSCRNPHLVGVGVKRFLRCTSPPLHSQIFDFACDLQPLKASVGLFHATDLCFQSRCLKHDWHRSLTSKPEQEKDKDGGRNEERKRSEDNKIYIFKVLYDYHITYWEFWIFWLYKSGEAQRLDQTWQSHQTVACLAAKLM